MSHGTLRAQKYPPNLKFAALPRCSLRRQQACDALRAGKLAGSEFDACLRRQESLQL